MDERHSEKDAVSHLQSQDQSQSSQYDATPVEPDTSAHYEASPMRKRGKRLSLANRDADDNGSLFNFASSQENMVILSSDSQQSASNSQDVVNRLGQLCKITQENSNSSSIIESEDSRSNFNDIMFSMPSLTPRLSNIHQAAASRNLPSQLGGGGAGADMNDEKKITISPALVNPFLTDQMGIRVSHKSKRPTTIWLQPYRERPRYMIDFEEEGIIGEGQFSVVYRARKRLDGTLYAVKKLKSRIHSETEGVVLLREVCALAALRGCPNLMRYYGSWIEDSHLWIQCELCIKVNLDVFVSFSELNSSNSGLQFSMPYKPRRSTTPHSCLGSEDSGAMWTQEGQDVGGNGGSDLDELGLEGGYQLTRHHHSFGSQSSSGFNMEGGSFDDDKEDEKEDEGPAQWLTFTPMVFWTVLLGVCRALAFMHSKGMAHLDIRPANVLLAPVPAYNSSKRYRASSHGNSSPARSSSGSGNSGASPSTSSFSLFASIQQSINMHTPREGPPGKVNANELKESYENEVEKTFQVLSNATKGSHVSTSAPSQQPSSGIAYNSNSNSASNSIKQSSRPHAAKNLSIHTQHAGGNGASSSTSHAPSHPDAPISAADVRDALVRGEWEVRVGDLGLCCSFGDYANFTEGESRYCAGELINGESGSQDFSQADMFSVGASLYEMCTGEPLSAGSQDNSSQWQDLRRGIFFREKHNIKLSQDSLNNVEGSAGVVTNSQNPVWAHYPEDILSVLKQLMDPNPAARPTAAAMVNLATNKLQALSKKRSFHSPRGPGSGPGSQQSSSSSNRSTPGAEETVTNAADLREEILKLQKENEALRQELSKRN